MGHLLFDLESDGLLDKLTTIHCLVTKDADSGLVRRFRAHGPPGETIGDGINLLSSADTIIGHNIIAFDIPAIRILYPKFKYNKCVDTLVCSRVIWTNLKDIDHRKRRLALGKLIGSHSLRAWGYRLKNLKGDFSDTDDETIWAKWTQEMEDYCAQDVEVTEDLLAQINRQQYSPVCLDLEHDFAGIVARQEREGMRFDAPAAETLAAKLIGDRAALTQELQQLILPRIEVMKTPAYYADASGNRYPTKKAAGKAKVTPGPPRTKEHPFNPGSRIQIARYLTESHGWKPKQFTESGQPEISEETLGELDFPEAKSLTQYLKLTKILGMVAEGDNAWLKLLRNGRIHGYVNSNGAVTGRCTHSRPNCSQVPAVVVGTDKHPVPGLAGGYGFECRSLYLPDEGEVLVGWDASGIELRCLAHFLHRFDGGAFAKVLLEGDVHTANQKAAGLYRRSSAKSMIYAFLYGAGDEKLGSIVVADAREAGMPPPKGTLREIGAALRARFLKNFPALGRLQNLIKHLLTQRDYLKGLDGRLLHVRSQHSALNTLLQSCGALLMKKAAVIQHAMLRDMAIPAKQRLTVHDELQFSVLHEYADIVGKSGPQSLKQAGGFFNFKCPLDGEYKVGASWALTH